MWRCNNSSRRKSSIEQLPRQQEATPTWGKARRGEMATHSTKWYAIWLQNRRQHWWYHSSETLHTLALFVYIAVHVTSRRGGGFDPTDVQIDYGSYSAWPRPNACRQLSNIVYNGWRVTILSRFFPTMLTVEWRDVIWGTPQARSQRQWCHQVVN